ncbi:MAG: hypothetical protein AB7P07_14455 [Hyphomonadaceae bacterium]
MIHAALLLPFALLQASPAPAEQSRFEQCVALIDVDAERAYEEGMAWAADAQSIDAYRCAAMALAAQNRHAEAARRFESLATALTREESGMRATLFVQAGHAWLLEREPERARSAFTRAVVTMEHDPQALPDLLIDRSRAYAMEGDHAAAEQDLNRALDIRGDDTLALRLRSAARLNQSAFDLAEADAVRALQVAQTEDDRVGAALALGHARESKRTGAIVEQQ